MSNNLDRHIAVVTDAAAASILMATDLNLVALISEFECIPQFFAPAKLSEIDARLFDGILFDDVEIDLTSSIQQVLRDMQADFKPIAVIGRSEKLATVVFGPTVELASTQNTPASDYISDRDFKVLSTIGTDVVGIRRMLRELIEMA